MPRSRIGWIKEERTKLMKRKKPNFQSLRGKVLGFGLSLDRLEPLTIGDKDTA